MVTESLAGEFTRRLAERIEQRVGHGVRGLVVSYRDDHVLIRGTARSYHAWQLTISACRESLTTAPHMRLDCLLQVEKSPAIANV